MRELMEYAERLMKLAPKLRDDEAAAVEQLRLMLVCGGSDLQRMLECRPITQHAFELNLPGAGRVDLALFHDDGGVTLIEVKGPEETRTLAAGIGQLFVYAGAIQKMRFGGRQPTSVAMFLAAPVSAHDSAAVCRACELAGIGFLRLSPSKHMKFLVGNMAGVSYA